LLTWLKKLSASYVTQRLMSPPLTSDLSQMNPVHILTQYLTSLIIVYTHLPLGHASDLFLSGFLAKIVYAFFISPLLATCHAHFTRLHLNTLVTFVKEYALCMQFSSPSCYLQILSTSLFCLLHDADDRSLQTIRIA